MGDVSATTEKVYSWWMPIVPLRAKTHRAELNLMPTVYGAHIWEEIVFKVKPDANLLGVPRRSPAFASS